MKLITKDTIEAMKSLNTNGLFRDKFISWLKLSIDEELQCVLYSDNEYDTNIHKGKARALTELLSIIESDTCNPRHS